MKVDLNPGFRKAGARGNVSEWQKSRQGRQIDAASRQCRAGGILPLSPSPDPRRSEILVGAVRWAASHASAGPLSPALSPKNPWGRGRTAGRGSSTSRVACLRGPPPPAARWEGAVSRSGQASDASDRPGSANLPRNGGGQTAPGGQEGAPPRRTRAETLRPRTIRCPRLNGWTALQVSLVASNRSMAAAKRKENELLLRSPSC